MLRVLLVAFALGACAGRQAPAATASPAGIAWPMQLAKPSTKASHREAAMLVLDSSGLQPVMDSMIDVTLESQLQVQPILKPYKGVMREFLAKYLSYAAIRDELADAYVERFDELQLRQIAAFYATPTGKLAVRKMPELAQLGAQIGKKHVEDHQAELIEMLKKAEAERTPDY